MQHNWTRRELLGVASSTLALPMIARASTPSNRVAIVRCREYSSFENQLGSAFDHIGGISDLVRGKTIALKLNLTGNPKNFPLTEALPYRTNGDSVAKTVHLLAKAGATRVRLIESFFPA